MKMTRFQVGVKIGKIAEKLYTVGLWKIGGLIEKLCKKVSYSAADMLFEYTWDSWDITCPDEWYE